MFFRGAVLLAVVAAALALSSGAQAGTVAESSSSDGNLELLQRFITIGKAIDYNVVADDPDGVYPFCVTLQLEKRTKQGWQRIGKDSGSYRHECLENAEEGESESETHAGWDAFVYPTRQIAKQFEKGKLRAHGFTDLGGELTYRR